MLNSFISYPLMLYKGKKIVYNRENLWKAPISFCVYYKG